MIGFRPLTESDLALLDGRLHRDHVRRWWREDEAADHVRDEGPGEHT